MHTNTKKAIAESITKAIAANLDTKHNAEVTVSDTRNTIWIVFKNRKSIPDIKLQIKVKHYSVYMADFEGNFGPALMSIRDIEEVKHFNKWYAILVKLSANRKVFCQQSWVNNYNEGVRRRSVKTV